MASSSKTAEPSATERRIVKPRVEARQGVTGHNVRYVLGFGLLGVILAFAVLYIVYFA